jgi:hypothetical protein
MTRVVKPYPRFTLATRIAGCGCSILLACFLLAVMFGAMMGDYIGPPEQRLAAERNRTTTVLLTVSGAALSGIFGVWILASKRRRP